MKIVYEEQRLGFGLGAALRRLGDGVDCQDVQFFITAVLLQSETGGNLAEILENIGFLIRERLKLKGKIKALTAEGRFSAIVLGLLPFIVFALFAMSTVSIWHSSSRSRSPTPRRPRTDRRFRYLLEGRHGPHSQGRSLQW